MNRRPGRRGGRAGEAGRGAALLGRGAASDRPPRGVFPAEAPPLESPVAVGEEPHRRAGGRAARTRQVPLLLLRGREGRMWSLSPPTSSPAASTTASAALGARRDSPAPTPAPRGAPRGAGRAESRAGLPGTRGACPGPERRSGRGERAPRERGMGPGGGLAGWAPASLRSRARSYPAPPAPLSPGPSPHRTLARARAARVTSGQVQRDVLLAAVIPPCAKHTHTAPVRTRGQASGGSPAPAGAQLAPQPGGRGQAGARGAGRRESGLRRAYLVFGGSSASGRGRSPPY